ncbi:MAG: hypothetical protein AAFN78_09185 [Pseudomonadota bacterium]
MPFTPAVTPFVPPVAIDAPKVSPRQRRSTAQWIAVGALCAATAFANLANAGPREQARRIHDRLAGVPPAEDVQDQMETLVAGGNALDAAYVAMDNSSFYNVTLKNLAAPWTNIERTVFVPLNDYTATVIGMVRDDVPFNTLFSADVLYIGSSGLGLPAYSMQNNDHYEQMEDAGVDLRTGLTATTQSAMTDLPPEAIAGVFTTRAAGEAFFSLGTNRAMFRFAMLNHLCNDMEQVHDITRPPDRIRQDVSRSPGGDSRIFLNNCVGCHSGMDPMAQAFAYYEFDLDAGRTVYTPNQVQPKYHVNAENFRFGFSTPDDQWENYWREGPITRMGWDASLPGKGSGAASMGDELANSDAFATCQVGHVFRSVCLRDPVDSADHQQISDMVASFRGSNFQLKQVFAESAVYCMGD